MTLEQYITAANILEVLVDSDSKAHELLSEAIAYQRIANSFHDLENEDAQRYNGYYRDNMRRCANRLMALTGLERPVVRRALITIATDRL